MVDSWVDLELKQSRVLLSQHIMEQWNMSDGRERVAHEV